MSDTDETATNGRDELGRFEPGNQCSRGRQNHSAELKRAFTEAVTVENIEAIVKTLVRMACDGDTAAAKLLLDRACGKVKSEGPMVAIQNNVGESGETKTQEALRFIKRYRAERAADPEAEARRQAARAEIQNPRTVEILDRIKSKIDERRAAMFSGAGMEPPIELRDLPQTT